MYSLSVYERLWFRADIQVVMFMRSAVRGKRGAFAFATRSVRPCRANDRSVPEIMRARYNEFIGPALRCDHAGFSRCASARYAPPSPRRCLGRQAASRDKDVFTRLRRSQLFRFTRFCFCEGAAIGRRSVSSSLEALRYRDSHGVAVLSVEIVGKYWPSWCFAAMFVCSWA